MEIYHKLHGNGRVPRCCFRQPLVVSKLHRNNTSIGVLGPTPIHCLMAYERGLSLGISDSSSHDAQYKGHFRSASSLAPAILAKIAFWTKTAIRLAILIGDTYHWHNDAATRKTKGHLDWSIDILNDSFRISGERPE